MNAVFLSSDVVMLEFGLALVVDEVQGRDTHSTRQQDVKRWSDGVEELVLAAITLPLYLATFYHERDGAEFGEQLRSLTWISATDGLANSSSHRWHILCLVEDRVQGMA
jgi:hypothetical protein